jgi:5-oxoprolinase (ATP-hydrolysing) subunit A
MSRRVINLNADMGESFGNYSFGCDEELIEVVPTANIACGFHAGDPRVMRETVALAADHGVEIGAHVGLPDLVGFGRRPMAVSAQQLHDDVLFQIGALWAFVHARGAKLAHVKPHGVLYTACGQREDYAQALVEAVASVDAGLRVIVGGSAVAAAGAGRGVLATNEGYVDLEYRPDGYPVIEARKQLKDPDDVAERAVRLVMQRTVRVKETGAELTVDVPTICVHGDTPNAGEVARAVRGALAAAGVEVVGLAAAMDAAVAPGEVPA